jgi:hypothetical protein
MATDEEIKRGLKASGVPESVFSTTLPREHAEELREMIVTKTLVSFSEARGVYIYPKTKTNTVQARRIFYLVAKELYLSGVTVACLSLSRLVELLNSEDYVGEAVRVDRVRVVFLLDFYEEGAPFPLSPQDAAKVRAWVRSRFESGAAVSFLSDAPVDRCSAWWPVSFLGFINENSFVHAVCR